MSDGPLPEGVVEEFASTYREWHYLAGGFSAGFATGVFVAARYLRGTNDP